MNPVSLLAFMLVALSPPSPNAASSFEQAPHAPAGAEWNWSRAVPDGRPLLVRLVRGSARIVQRRGPIDIRLRVHSESSDPRAVSFEVKESPTRIEITDRYPTDLMRSFKECLPPPDARGDFWSSDIVVDEVISVPPGVAVATEIMDPRPPRRDR